MNKIIIKSFIIIVILIGIVSITAYIWLKYTATNEADQSHNSSIAKVIRIVLSDYIIDSEDYELKFDQEKPIEDIDQIITKLQSEIKIKGYNYGPYLENGSYKPSRHKFVFFQTKCGWKIVVYKDTKEVSVEVSDKNELILK